MIYKRILLIIGATLIFFTSCTSINKSHKNSSVNITIKSEMKAKIDVDMSRKLVGYASGGYLFHILKAGGDSKYIDDIRFNGNDGGIFSFISKVQTVKGAAAYNAIRTSDADVLVDPQYVIEENNWNPFYKLIKVKVTGYAGKIVSIK